MPTRPVLAVSSTPVANEKRCWNAGCELDMRSGNPHQEVDPMVNPMKIRTLLGARAVPRLACAVFVTASLFGGMQAHAQGNSNGANGARGGGPGLPASGVNGVYPAPMQGVEPGVAASGARATRTANRASQRHAHTMSKHPASGASAAVGE
ncbi:hypothetical protein [Paraburkholderia tropica]|uniref:hypothetical protein n=2 Tax=Paraburkholderia tropica TaxID=92647 RepID=UPI001600428C|nr:hypothetical protein [Paraburkholderia tropica]QNB11371.1 hypothetical protein G5S35_07140 [Paraburkholderia tropica]